MGIQLVIICRLGHRALNRYLYRVCFVLAAQGWPGAKRMKQRQKAPAGGRQLEALPSPPPPPCALPLPLQPGNRTAHPGVQGKTAILARQPRPEPADACVEE